MLSSEGGDVPQKPGLPEPVSDLTVPRKSLSARPMMITDDDFSAGSGNSFHTPSPGGSQGNRRDSIISQGSDYSESSTIIYGHEPFETFKSRVIELCKKILQPRSKPLRLRDRLIRALRLKPTTPHSNPPPLSFSVERMHGNLNRIIGITAVDTQAHSQTRFVLRIPRFDDAHPEREVAILNYVRKHSSVPVPTIAAQDFTSRNLLSSQFVIQGRIPGFDLQNSDHPFPTLTFEQKYAFVERFGQILLDIVAIRSSGPGQVKPLNKAGKTPKFSINHFEVGEIAPPGESRKFDDLSNLSVSPSYATTLDFFKLQFGRWKNVATKKNILKPMYMERLTAVAVQMDQAGYLGDNQYCLAHLDLPGAPRNVMANFESDGSLAITGILDWDEAVFAPKFVACVAPMWIWAWNDEDEEDERKANEDPATSESQQLKRLFEETVGPEYLRYAYQPEYRLARKLFDFAMHGVHSNWRITEGDELIEEWARLRPEGMPLIESLRLPDEI